MKKRLTPSAIKGLAPTDKPYDCLDAGCPGLAVRVLGQKGAPIKSFVVVGRFPGRTNPTRVKIGSFLDSWSLERGWEGLNEARATARNWVDQIQTGVDPRVEIALRRQVDQKRRAMTFGRVAEDFIRDKLPSERRGADVEREIRKEFSAWWPRPASAITKRDVLEVIKSKKKTAPSQARNLLGHVKRLFRWAVDQDEYDIGISPANDIRPNAIVGEKIARERCLDDMEFRAFWIAAGGLPYPAGPMFKLLTLTGVRLSSASDARWSEDGKEANTLRQPQIFSRRD
jgi:integrase